MKKTNQQNASNNGLFRTSLDVQEISVQYNETTDDVTVTPGEVSKGTIARFKNPSGKLRIMFLSPSGREMEPVSDSELCELAIGGIYHFKCFFLSMGQKNEISPENGGVIDVLPHRP